MAETGTVRRIGAFGGTFDPIHNGHLAIALAVVERFELDELLLIPAARPPHKATPPISDPYHRYAMAVMASLGQDRLRVSAMELAAPEKPYTYQTVDRLREQYGPDTRLYFVMGSDSFREILAWREPERLLASANIIVAARPGAEIGGEHLAPDTRANIVDVRGTPGVPDLYQTGPDRCLIYLTADVERDISSTRIRELAGQERDIAELVPALVARHIEKYDLYRR